jgi:transposase
VRDAKVRTWDDLPWAEHPVALRYPLRRLWCQQCGIRTERVGFADPHARLTRRFRQRIGLGCQSMPTSHAATRHAVSWGTTRRAERAFLDAWDRTRPKHRPRHLGADEIQRGKGQQFWTVLSDLVRGEVIGLSKDRSEDSLRTLLTTRLEARQRAAVEAVCTDMHRPYLNAVAEVLDRAEIVFDKFHVLQHASAALDEMRRQEFFRAGAGMREHGRGKTLAPITPLEDPARVEADGGTDTLRREPAPVQSVRAARATRPPLVVQDADRRLEFPARLDRRLRWQRLPEMERLGCRVR